jgi:hypothetical protein
MAEPEHDDLPSLERVERLPDASHWVHHNNAERVNQLRLASSHPPNLGEHMKFQRGGHFAAWNSRYCSAPNFAPRSELCEVGESDA